MQQKDNDGLVSRKHGLCEVVLIAKQGEIIAVALVLGSPRFAGRLLVVAENENYDVSFLGGFDSIGDALGIQRRFAKHNFVSVPV